MKRRYEAPERPHGRPDLRLVHGGAAGTWLRGSDGLDLRLAAPEAAPVVQRERLSALGLLLAVFASGERPR